MRESRTPAPSPSVDGDGVRVYGKQPARSRRLPLVVALLSSIVAAAVLWHIASTPRGPLPTPPAAAAQPASDVPSGAMRHATRTLPPSHAASATHPHSIMPTPQDPADWPGGDPRDLASHFRPGDPEPSAAEVIRALQDAGDHTGLGAFNPPGTSPPLQGLAVPPDFALPPGYVRHHQVTDDGVVLEPILMFAPDFAAVDATGLALDVPQDRVVPPELAPAGLPIRTIEVPAP